jgi:hypothetical protein
MRKCVLITGASGVCGYHLNAAAGTSATEGFAWLKPGSSIQHAFTVTNYRAGNAAWLYLTGIRRIFRETCCIKDPAKSFIKALSSNVTNRHYTMSDEDNHYPLIH